MEWLIHVVVDVVDSFISVSIDLVSVFFGIKNETFKLSSLDEGTDDRLIPDPILFSVPIDDSTGSSTPLSLLVLTNLGSGMRLSKCGLRMGPSMELLECGSSSETRSFISFLFSVCFVSCKVVS